MSLVVAVRRAAGWELRSDLGVYLGSTAAVGTPKAASPVPGLGVGRVGSSEWCTVVGDVTWPDPPTIGGVRAALAAAVADADYEPGTPDVALVVVEDELWYLDGIRAAERIDLPYWAIGSGADYVLGLLEFLTGWACVDPDLGLVVDVASRVCSEVRGISPAVRVEAVQ